MFRPRVEARPNIARSAKVELAEHLKVLRHLTVVPRRRKVASILAPALILVFVAMLGVTTFQTRMAQDQVELDQLQAKVVKARLLHQELERQQSDLRSPVRLGREATRLGLAPAEAVGFVSVDSDTYSGVLESASRAVSGESTAAP